MKIFGFLKIFNHLIKTDRRLLFLPFQSNSRYFVVHQIVTETGSIIVFQFGVSVDLCS